MVAWRLTSLEDILDRNIFIEIVEEKTGPLSEAERGLVPRIRKYDNQNFLETVEKIKEHRGGVLHRPKLHDEADLKVTIPLTWQQRSERIANRHRGVAEQLRRTLGLKKPLAQSKIDSWIKQERGEDFIFGYAGVGISYVVTDKGKEEAHFITLQQDIGQIETDVKMFQRLREEAADAAQREDYDVVLARRTMLLAAAREKMQPSASLKRLFSVKRVAAQLAKSTGWTEAAAVNFLLCDSVPLLPYFQVTEDPRWLKEEGLLPAITIHIGSMDVSAETVRQAYLKVRYEMPGIRTARPQRPGERSAKLVQFVEERPATSWKDRLKEWNKVNPKSKYKSVAVMKSAHTRAKRRLEDK